jgi:pimeloyl-ACP methyl ester carboxylesterase
MLERREYELTSWRVPGPVEPIPLLLYHRSDLSGRKPPIVYYHGVTQTKEAYVDTHPIARRLADAGMLVALPDAPGHGERPTAARLVDRLRESLPREFTADIEQAADEAPALAAWLGARPDLDLTRLAVVGTSMGGFTAAVVAGRLRQRLRTAVCIAGCADLPGCFAATDSIGAGGWGPLDRSIDRETAARIERIDPLRHPDRLAGLPVLLLHGERDTWNPCSTSVRFGAALASARVRIAPEAGHWPPNPEIVEAAVSWLRDHV